MRKISILKFPYTLQYFSTAAKKFQQQAKHFSLIIIQADILEFWNLISGHFTGLALFGLPHKLHFSNLVLVLTMLLYGLLMIILVILLSM